MEPTRAELSWRRFTLDPALPTIPTGKPREILATTGVPFLNDAETFYPLSSLRLMRERYLEFSSAGPGTRIALDLRFHRVVAINGSTQRFGVSFVNSTLERYVRSFTVFAAGLPYNPDGDYLNDTSLDTKAEALIREIAKIDPPAAEDGTFWGELRWDITVGDWSDDEALQ